MTTLVLMVWITLTMFITFLGFCLVAVFAYAGALWDFLRRGRKQVTEPEFLRRDREFSEHEYLTTETRRTQRKD